MAGNREGEIPHEGLATIQMQALVGQFERLHNRKLERIHERIDQVAARQNHPNNPSEGVLSVKGEDISSECPNKRTMLINSHGDWEIEEEIIEEEEELSNEDDSGESAVEGELLMARRALSIQVMENENNQRENLFHTRCQIQDKVCSVIIDGGSCSNVASVELVEKLTLPTFKHRCPYRLQWLNDCGEMKVTKQVKVLFSIGKYKHVICC
ncbi:hypothetical protein L6164_008499 [Bauhinia variegata]|uniref:Uncharacterized protein n=1 Tax=Bauhinia variegata TaxID=167791 RepID=A0ACB9PGP2_BAUVA|nr:hypothetical protein L6164_008499 [Bauhinia variegata]